jgi:cellulase/cellobiase CelA1
VNAHWVNYPGNGGFTATVTVSNYGTQPINSWQVKWSFAVGQAVVSAWNAALSQSGSEVVAGNEPYNGSLGPGQSTSFGFEGIWNAATNPVPELICS